MKTNRFLLTIYSITIIETIALYYIYGLQGGGDTSGYIEAWNNISHGEIDYFRTPVYPIILGLSFLFSEKAPFFLVLLIQGIVYLFSIYCFNKISFLYLSNKKIAMIVIAIYALFPVYISWNITILTESLALSGFVIFLYCFIYSTLSESKSLKMLVTTIISLVLLVFLRPSFMILVLIVALVWLLQWYKYRSLRKYYSVGIGCLLIACLSFHCYMHSYKTKYGIYATSSVGLINQYYMARDYGYIVPSEFKDEEISKYVANACSAHDIKSESLFKESFDLFNTYKYKSDVLKDGLESSVKQNKLLWVKGYYERVKKVMKNYFYISRIVPITKTFAIFGFDFHILSFLLLFHLVFIFNSINNGHWPIISIIFLLIPLFTLFMISIGAQSEWGRLFLPVSPCILLILGRMFNYSMKITTL